MIYNKCIQPNTVRISLCKDFYEFFRCCYTTVPFYRVSIYDISDVKTLYNNVFNNDLIINSKIAPNDFCKAECEWSNVKNVVISTSKQCNLNCFNCYSSSHKDSLYIKNLYFESIKALKGRNLEQISLNGSGEVFIYFNEIIKIISTFTVDDVKTIEFYSNINLLDEKKLKVLKNISQTTGVLFKFVVSIDGITKDTYEAVRVGGNFEKTIKNLKLLKKYFNDDILVIYTIKQPNFKEDLSDVESFFTELNTSFIIRYDIFDKRAKEIYDQYIKLKENVMKLNVVLFHIGVYDETQPGYKSLYKKFYDSVLREFKDDNIIVFHNYDEVFKKFPSIKDLINKYFSDFYNTNNDQLRCDLLRMLLCIFLKDYLYIDSDIYISQGFREILLETINKKENKDKLFFNIEKGTIAIFYSKRYFKKFNVYLKLFELNNYKYDTKALKDSNFYSLDEVYCDGDNGHKVCDKKLHYGGMLFMTNYMVHDYYIEYTGKVDAFEEPAMDNRLVLCYIPQQKHCVLNLDIKTTCVYFIQNEVKLEDILDALDVKHEKVNINKMRFNFNCLYPKGALWITCDSFSNEIELKRCLWHNPYEKMSIENYLKIDDIIQYSIDHEYSERDSIISEGEKIKCHQKCVLPKNIKNVSVSISHACNLNCYHCYFDGRHYDTPEMKKAYFDTLYKIKGHQLDKILLTDNGEPFVYYDEILEYIQSLSQNDTKCIEITTNLTLLNKEKIGKLYKAITKANIDYSFIVSLDGITKETFEATRIGASWTQVTNNLKILTSFFGHEKIVVSYVIRKPALKDAPFARSFFRKKFGLRADIYYDYFDDDCQKYFLSLEEKEFESLD